MAAMILFGWRKKKNMLGVLIAVIDISSGYGKQKGNLLVTDWRLTSEHGAVGPGLGNGLGARGLLGESRNGSPAMWVLIIPLLFLPSPWFLSCQSLSVFPLYHLFRILFCGMWSEPKSKVCISGPPFRNKTFYPSDSIVGS